MRIPQLDLLRLIAVLLVMGRHLTPCPEVVSPALASFTRAWHRGGWIGVDLFFVLSGFLVSGLLFREHQRTGAIRSRHFLIRRGFKIYPAFWVLIATTLVVGGTRQATLHNVVGELLFFQNYVGRLWNHTWSLAIEEHFYFLLVAWVAWRCRRRPEAPFDGLGRWFGAIAAGCLGLRAVTAFSGVPYSHDAYLYPTHLRIDSLLFGVWLSHAWHYRGLGEHPWLVRGAPLVAGVGLSMLAPPFFFRLETTPWLPVVGLAGLYLGSGLLMLAMLATDPRRFRWLSGLARAGSYSYSIYLWHMPMALWGIGLLARRSGGTLDWYTYAAVYLGGAIVLGIVAAKLIELPVLRLRDRLYPSRGRSLSS